MKNSVLVSIVAVSVVAGILLEKQWPMTVMPMVDGAIEQDQPLYWVAPMDDQYRRNQPGKSPMGMDLVPVYSEAENPSLVTISPTVEQNLGLRVAEVVDQPMNRSIETVGFVQLDEEELSHIHVRVDGWIEQLEATAVGDKIEAGQRLFKFYSPALISAQEEYIVALNSANRPLVEASRIRLLSLGMNPRDLQQLNSTKKALQLVNFYAHRDGFITDLSVREGMYIKPDSEVIAIADLSSVWVIAEVFERQAAWLAQGQSVLMTTVSGAGRQWRGEVEAIYPVLQQQTRTVQVRIRFDNADFSLKPNMFANLTIKADEDGHRLQVPSEAVIQGGRFDRVVKRLGDGRYRSVIIKKGIEFGGMIEILEGLSSGDEVVVSAQFLIDSESNIEAEIARLDGMRESAVEDETAIKKQPARGAMRCGADMDMSETGKGQQP
ncbi:Cation efflux system protein CusB [Sinobacterium norvegicum]|uniref:Cation efflux system protein CusB n=1 Tax=Sinobacterium norvegicum TaxID=1641715 RepID=A0ABM9AHV8_9GAMM|nr:efflux RND transporter periplasmic adaptor subunit [Sinobacterium norvegicum]CAH0992724.1 Cation efflux system protein CusB [Sinobacterium norvegicum]